nr:MAG TPA: minor tail protein [Caudoviricetes sp.]
MANRIRGITVEIGGDTTGLSKALSGINKKIKDTQTELKDVNRLLKIDPQNTELLKQKYDLLNQSIESTEKKLDVLRQAEKQVQEQFKSGQVNENQYNALKREVIATEAQLRDLKTEAQGSSRAIKEVDERSVEEVAEAADEAGESLKDAGKEASNFGGFLKASAIVEGSKAIVSEMKDITEESREYMKIMGSLKISSQAAGYTADETAESYKTLVGVLGDTQTAATTTANLQALGLSQEQLRQVINGTIGAWASYGDSIPIDGLAEAINETVKTGKVTGTFADALNWAGASEDAFNQKLQAASSESERANLILQQLASQGLIDAGEAWQENNKVLIENNQANAGLQEQLARLGEMVMPIITSVTRGIADIISWFLSLSPEVKNMIGLVATIVTTIAGVAAIIKGISAAQAILNTVIAASPIGLIITAIATLIAGFIYLWNTSEEFREFWINLWENICGAFSIAWNTIVGFFTETIPNAINYVLGIFENFDNWLTGIFSTDWSQSFGAFGEILNGFFANVENIWNAIKKAFGGIIDFITGIFTGDWEKAWQGIQDFFGGIWDGMVAIVKAPLNGIIGLINGAIDGINWMIGGLNTLSFDVPDWVPFIGGSHFGLNIPLLGKIPYLAKGGILSQGSAVVGEAGPELLTMMGNRAVVQPLTSQTSNTTNLGGINIVVYGAPGQDVQKLADIIMDEMQSATNRKGAVWA